MRSQYELQHEFPISVGLADRELVLRPLGVEDRQSLLAFAQDLAEDDLLFLQRDITNPAKVDAWIEDDVEGKLATVVACEEGAVVGFATFELGRLRWTRHVAELRVVVAEAARGIGIGRLLLELAFELALDVGATKIIARMTPEQSGAVRLFQRLGFEQEAVLQDHAMGAGGLTHDLLVLAFHPHKRQEQTCENCGVPVLNALSVDGARLCAVLRDAVSGIGRRRLTPKLKAQPGCIVGEWGARNRDRTSAASGR